MVLFVLLGPRLERFWGHNFVSVYSIELSTSAPIKLRLFPPISWSPPICKYNHRESQEWLGQIVLFSDFSDIWKWRVQIKANCWWKSPTQTSSRQKQLVRALLQPVESRNLTVTGLVQSLFERFVVAKNRQSCWSASCPSSGLCEKSLKILRQICVSRGLAVKALQEASEAYLVGLFEDTKLMRHPHQASPSCPRTLCSTGPPNSWRASTSGIYPSQN